MRTLSFRPSLRLRGRKFQGLRGYAGKPFHPPLTDVPIGCYMLALVLDVISRAAGSRSAYLAGTYALTFGAAVSILAALTGFWDWLKSTEKGTQARRTVNAHAWTMVTVTVLVLAETALRWTTQRDAASTSVFVLVMSVLIAIITTLGATIGGSLVFDYGFNVVTGGDHPAWHRSETDVLPGEKRS